MTKKKKKLIPNKLDALDLALEQMRQLLSPGDFQALLAELDQPLRQAIRLNPLKVNPEQILPQWEQRFGWKTSPIPYCNTGYWMDEAQTPLSKPLEYHFGQYYIQDAASMLPVELFDFPSHAPLVLDMAASPGGKTTHILSRLMDKGFVLANDASKSRLTALQLVLQNWGAVNVGVCAFNGESFGEWYPDTFDAVLLDAPCSMQNLRNTDTHPMRAITDSERQNLSSRQQRLLSSALNAVRPGGEVVYATCTLSPEEDELVLDQIKQKYGAAVEIVNMSDRLPHPVPGLPVVNEMVLDDEVANALRIWPHLFHTSGFFCAKIRKLQSWRTAEYSSVPNRDMAGLGWLPISPAILQLLTQQLQQNYGFDLATWQQTQAVRLIQYQEKVFAFPEMYFQYFDGLPVQMLGMLMGQFSADQFSPDHDFITRFFALFHHGKQYLPAELESAWLRGEEIRGWITEGALAGKVQLTCNQAGDYLGLGKVSGERYRNLLPRRVIR
jgi:16S rRNA (cytosine1407-C5)-methyltransferase